MKPSDELAQIVSEQHKVIAREVSLFYSDLVKASPVDTGTFRSAWEINEVKNVKWTISNNVEYASILWSGRRYVGNRAIGSEQWQEGGEPMLQKFNNKLTRLLK